MIAGLLFLSMSISSNFEGGSVGKVERTGPAHFRCAVKGESDQDGRNRQANWYFFRVDKAAGRKVVVDLVNLPGEYNYRANRGAVTADTIPVYSENGRSWRHFDRTAVEYDEREPLLRLRVEPRGQRFWIAHVPPYTNANLESLLAEFRSNASLRVNRIGRTPRGRPLLLLSVTDASVSDAGKRVVWLMFRQHSWETGSSWSGEGAMRFLLSDAAAEIRRGAVFKVFPLCDPDGVARGGVRFNQWGFDLNRNWDVGDAARMPEISAQRRAVLDWIDSGHRIDLFVSLHNTETAEYLEAPPAKDGQFDELTHRFFEALLAQSKFGPTRQPSRAEDSTTAGKPGRMTVIQGLYRDRRIPGFLIEQKIANNPTTEDRKAFGAGLVRAAWEAVR